MTAAGDEISLGLELEGHTGEVAADFRERQLPPSDRGIQDRHAARRQPFEHDEMAHVPVQNGTRSEVLEFFELESNAAPPQPKRSGGAEQVEHADPVATRANEL